MGITLSRCNQALVCKIPFDIFKCLSNLAVLWVLLVDATEESVRFFQLTGSSKFD